MIVLITTLVWNESRNVHELLVSHGIDYNTGKTIILPCDPPHMLGGKFNKDLQEWVLYDKDEEF